jgi:hypothetical protein
LTPLRQRILYAEQFWRQMRLWPFFMLFAGPLIGVYLYFSQRHNVLSALEVAVLYELGGLLYLAGMLYYRHRSHLRARDDGLQISNLLHTVVIPYEEIRTVRVQPLRTHFQDSRKRYVRTADRPLLDKPALFVRLRREEMAMYVRRKLGSRLAFEDTVALPVPDPDQLAWHLNGRLPEKVGTNLGGGRRKKRRR